MNKAEKMEDASLVKTIQKTPERRVFYVDVGSMPEDKVIEHIEKIRNQIKEK